MEKIWLKNYPQDVPAEINPDLYQSIPEIFEECCTQFASRPAYYNLGTTLTYAELNAASLAFAAYLQQVLKLKKGDRVAIMLPNVLQYPVALFGILRAGLVVVNVNPLYTAPEVVHQVKDSGAETIIVLSNFARTVQKAFSDTPLKHVIVAEVGDMLPQPKAWLVNFVLKNIQRKIPAWQIPHALSFKKVLQEGRRLTLEPVVLRNQDIAFLQYTGGTTGVSKGAILTHRNLIANLLQLELWLKPAYTKGKEIMVSALPLYHVFSLTACLFAMKIGALSLLITNPRDIKQMVSDLKKFKFSVMTGVNTLYSALQKNRSFRKLDFNTLSLAIGGGMAVQRVVAEQWQSLTGVPLLEAYGLTETSPCVTFNPVNIKSYNGTVGLPVSSTDIRILDDAGNAVAIGQAGELAVKGPQVMRGYWQNPVETEKVINKEGWLLTGDLASVDENGFVKILERKKDMILVSGFNVYPNEIEDVLVSMPGIREAAVIAVPDASSGEVPKAFIVRDNPNLTVEEVIKFCRTKLTGYKIPKHVKFCDELPKTNVGKVLRRGLRQADESH